MNLNEILCIACEGIVGYGVGTPSILCPDCVEDVSQLRKSRIAKSARSHPSNISQLDSYRSATNTECIRVVPELFNPRQAPRIPLKIIK